MDDLFFTGSSIELVNNGRFINPWLAGWTEAFASERFYYFPPALPYLLAGWIFIFGVSTASITAFHMGVHSVLQMATLRLARRAGAGLLTSLAAAAIAGLLTAGYGLRPDTLALALVALAQFPAFRKDGVSWLVSAVFSAAAVITHPLALALVLPLFVLQMEAAARHGAPRLQFLAWTSAGVMVVFGGFLVAISGEIVEFIRTMNTHRGFVVAGGWLDRPGQFWQTLGLGWEPWFCGAMYALALVTAVVTCVRDDRLRTVWWRRLWTAWAIALLLGAFLYPGRMVRYGAYTGIALAVVAWSRRPAARPVACAALGLAVLHNAALFLEPFFSDRSRPDPDVVREIVLKNRHKTLCVDEVAARYVFDFKLPPNSRDWLLRQAPPKGAFGRAADKPADELWIANEWKFERYVPDSGVRASRLQVGPFAMQSQPGSPYRLHVLE
ncbi:MAG TPA: hypothetical protein VEQ65_01720 [Opitutus sp.]|nr:hypothetical protein [Opitutus sp.]